MFFMAIGLIAGFGIGCLLPMSMQYISAVCIVLTVILPAGSIVSTMFIAGYLLASYLQSIFLQSHDTSNKFLKTETATANINELGRTFISACFIVTFATAALAGANSMMVYSIYLICQEIYKIIIYKLTFKKGLIRSIIGIVVLLIGGYLTVSNISKIAIFAYFIFIKTLPTAFGKVSKATEKTDRADVTTGFAYGINGSSPAYIAMVLAQTILWSSEKDTLGTIINQSLPEVLSIERFMWAMLTLACIKIFFLFIERMQPRLEKYINKKQNNKSEANYTILTQRFLLGASLSVVFIHLGFIYALWMCVIGVVANLCLESEDINKLAVPNLLISGIFLQ